MNKKLVSGIMLTPLLVSILTLTFTLRTAQASPGTTLYVDPKLNTASPGESFTVDINIQDVVDLYSYEVKLGYNPDILEVVSIEEGPFIIEQTTSPYDPPTVWSTIIQEHDGWCYAACVTLGRYPGITGSGTLFNVTFNVVDPGECDLDLYDSLLLDSTVGEISHDVTDGYFSTTISLSATVDIDPDTLNLNSKGKWVTAYIELPEGYDVEDIIISTILLEGFIPPEMDSKYGFVKNPEAKDIDDNGIPEVMVKFNRADLTSYIYNVLGIKLGDVTLTVFGQLDDGTPFEGSDTIRATFAGDINKNNVIDVMDISLLAGSYGTMKEEVNYDKEIDLNSDGVIDMRDLVAVAVNLGATIPD